MAPEAAGSPGDRVLVVPLTRRDGEVTLRLLRRLGAAGTVCRDLHALVDEMARGVGAVVLSEAALVDARVDALVGALETQPDWSDVPIVMAMHDRGHSIAAIRVLELLRNVTLLDRPTSTRSMASAVRAALAARRRQYQLRDRMAEQQRVEQALREAERRKDEFLAMLAHELRNPLAPLTNALRLLDRAEPIGERGRWAVAMATRQTAQLSRLVDDLLEVSRISRGLIVLTRRTVDLNVAAREAADAVAEDCAARGHSLAIDASPEPVAVEADPVRVAQILGNLLGNAVKYTPDGGRISLRVSREPRHVRIDVTDSGIGIAPAELDGLFQPFHQVDATLDRSRGGLGIGLAMVRGLVELHGGHAEACSDGLGRGSTFTIRLPRP